ncbi:hypothetical protein Rsub_00007 [Raphidocelis subcapitata]|uniref:Uncharacterized protein n=1 Tax=Raphidocelis subcapitata TaxID=307507 RepID=A0A2V0NJ61_9CHLO|nr:hypothetical protein Rsub_00007 [Raphidocelis subcapitata]|eukprot:GBF87296.1 hypothetical protein Rsub_00007 [Raphidocelis subcapitata]
MTVAVDPTGLLATLTTIPPRDGGARQAAAAATLTVPLGGRAAPPVVDPVSGAVLRLRGPGRTAVVAQPRRVRQPLARSRRFWLEAPLDLAIHRLRSVAPPISSYTNEAVCTAGTPTGVDRTLLLRQPVADGASAALRASAAGLAAVGGVAAAATAPPARQAGPAVHRLLGFREQLAAPGTTNATAARAWALAVSSLAARGVRGLHATPALDPSPPAPPPPSRGSTRAAGLAELGAQLRAAGLSEAAVLAVSEQLPGWPSLSRDPEGFRARVEGLLRLAGGDARLASAALAREPRLLTRVPDALRRESAALARLLGCGADGVARLVAAAPQALMTLGAQGVEQRLDGLAAALVASAAPGQRPRRRGGRKELRGPPAVAATPEGPAAGGAAGSGADHPCAPLVLRAPELLTQSAANTQQRLASLAAALHEIAGSGGGGSSTSSGGGSGGSTSGGIVGSPETRAAHGAQAPAAAAHRTACALVRASPELLLMTGQTLAGRVRELRRLLGLEAVAELCTPRHAALLAPLLLRRGEQLRRRLESLQAMLPGLMPRQLLVLLGRRELRWDQLDFLRHAGAVPAWGAHHRTRQQPSGSGGECSSSSSSSGVLDRGGSGSGSSGSSSGVFDGGADSSGGAVQALHVARLALTREPYAFARQHPEFPGWQALRQAVHAAPGECGWRAQFDRELVGPALTAWLRGMAGRWPRLLVCRANLAALSAAEARQRRAQQRAGPGGAADGGAAGSGRAGGDGGADEDRARPLLPSLQRLQGMDGVEWAVVAGRLPVQLPPPLGGLPDSEALGLLRAGSGALATRVAAYAAAWDAVAAEAAAGLPGWQLQLQRWRELLPAAIADAGAAWAGEGGAGPSEPGDHRQAELRALSSWWHCLLDDRSRAALLSRLRFLRRAAGDGGEGPAAGAGLWPALAAREEAFAADYQGYAAWRAVVALARGRPEWEADLAGPALQGGALAEWLRAVAAGRLERLRFLAVTDGGGGWRACGLREAVVMDEDAFGDLFPDYRYGAWRLLLAGGGSSGGGGQHGGLAAEEPAALGRTPASEASSPAGSGAAAAPGGAARRRHAGNARAGEARAAAASAAAPVLARRSAALMGVSHDLTEVADRDPAWCAEARRWTPATWRRALQAASKRPALLSRARFLLATGGAGAGAAARPPLASVLTQRAQTFEAAHPTFVLWSGLRAALAGIAPWRAQLEGWPPEECAEVLSAVLEACSAAGPSDGATPSGAGAAADGQDAAGPQPHPHPHPRPQRRAQLGRERAAAATSEALARVKFLAARARWRRVEGGLREALLAPRDALVRRWPQYDPPRAEALAALQAALERPPQPPPPDWVGPQALAPGIYEALPAHARAAADAGRLEALQRLAHTSAAWEAALKQYGPRTLERMLVAAQERLEHAAYLAATGRQQHASLVASIGRPPAEWEAGDPDFANWRRLSALVDGLPKWQRWWEGAKGKGRKPVASALSALRALDEGGWAVLEAARAEGGGGAANPVLLARRLAKAAAKQSGSRGEEGPGEGEGEEEQQLEAPAV